MYIENWTLSFQGAEQGLQQPIIDKMIDSFKMCHHLEISKLLVILLQWAGIAVVSGVGENRPNKDDNRSGFKYYLMWS